jgi:hypothetical protein
MFEAARSPLGIVVRWQVANGPEGQSLWIERANTEAGPWTRIETVRTHEGEATVVELDQSVVPGESCWYRLVSREAGQDRVVAAPIEVSAAVGSAFGLIAVGPNPSRGPVDVEFALARQASIGVDVLDIQGRSVASLARGIWPAGQHHVEWSGSSGRVALGPGVYLVRYRYPGGQEFRRVICAK